MELFLLQYDSVLGNIGVNIIFGLSMYVCLKAGAFSLAQVGVGGVTAYITALLSINSGTGIVVAIIVGACLGGAIGLLVNVPALRLRGVYLAIATLSFSEIVRVTALNLDVTGGPLGLNGIPDTASLGVIYICVIAACIVVALVDNSRFGRSLDAMRLDEDAAKALGVRTSRQLVKMFALSGVMAGVAGALYAHKSLIITPSNFSFTFATLILTIVIVGGVGHWAGAVIAAIVLTALPAVLAGTSLGAGWPQMLIQGVITLAVVFFYPVGMSAIFLPVRRWMHRTGIKSHDSVPPPEFSEDIPAGPVLEARSVGRNFGGVVALTGVNLAVDLGQVLGLIGPNGAGKTTLVNQLSGADIPSTGEVLIDGKVVRHPSMAQFADLGITRTFQRSRVFDDMTLIENVEIGLFRNDTSRIYKQVLTPWSIRRIDRQRRLSAIALLEQVGLSDRAHDKANALSYGQKRRLEIARALAVNPRVLLLDEPAAGMNAAEKEGMVALIRAIRDQGRGVLVIEHDLPLVRAATDEVCLLNLGAQLLSGAPDYVLNAPETVEAYVGTAGEPLERHAVSELRTVAEVGGISVNGLHAGYGSVNVLQDVAIDVPRGTTVAVLGANGAGKSTLLKTISGIIRPTAGTVVIDGEETSRWSSHRKVARCGSALVPEDRAIVAKLTVRENLLIGYRKSNQRNTANVLLDEMFERFPILRERAEQLGDTLSGGEQQMLAIARALMAEPEFLILDEPSTGLAPKMVKQVTLAIATIAASGTTVLWVEQNATDALALSDFAYVMELGKVTTSGRSALLAQDPSLISAYLSTSNGTDLSKED